MDRLLRHWTLFGKDHAAKNSDFERDRVATLPCPWMSRMLSSIQLAKGFRHGKRYARIDELS